MADKEPAGGWTEGLGEHAENPPTPSTSGEMFPARGQMWQLGGAENRIKSQFEKWVRKNAMEVIAEANAEQFQDMGRKMMSAYIQDRAAAAYVWGGSAVVRALNDSPGIKYFVYLLLKRANPTMTETLAGDLFEESPKEATMAMLTVMGNWRTSPATAASEVNGKPKKAKVEEEELVTMDSP